MLATESLCQLHNTDPENTASEELVAEILESFLEQEFAVSGIPFVNEAREEERIYWLNFKGDGASFKIGVDGSLASSRSLYQLSKNLIKKDFSEFGFKELKLQDHVLLSISEKSRVPRSFLCRSERLCFEAWLLRDADFRISPSKARSKLFTVSLPVYLESADLLGKAPIMDVNEARIIIDGSSLVDAKLFICKLIPQTFQQILELEEFNMDETLKPLIKLGALELKLEELLSLRSGSKITFALPKNTRVELELGGRTFGSGRIEVIEERFVLSVDQIVC